MAMPNAFYVFNTLQGLVLMTKDTGIFLKSPSGSYLAFKPYRTWLPILILCIGFHKLGSSKQITEVEAGEIKIEYSWCTCCTRMYPVCIMQLEETGLILLTQAVYR